MTPSSSSKPTTWDWRHDTGQSHNQERASGSLRGVLAAESFCSDNELAIRKDIWHEVRDVRAGMVHVPQGKQTGRRGEARLQYPQGQSGTEEAEQGGKVNEKD